MAGDKVNHATSLERDWLRVKSVQLKRCGEIRFVSFALFCSCCTRTFCFSLFLFFFRRNASTAEKLPNRQFQPVSYRSHLPPPLRIALIILHIIITSKYI